MLITSCGLVPGFKKKLKIKGSSQVMHTIMLMSKYINLFTIAAIS